MNLMCTFTQAGEQSAPCHWCMLTFRSSPYSVLGMACCVQGSIEVNWYYPERLARNLVPTPASCAPSVQPSTSPSFIWNSTSVKSALQSTFRGEGLLCYACTRQGTDRSGDLFKSITSERSVRSLTWFPPFSLCPIFNYSTSVWQNRTPDHIGFLNMAERDEGNCTSEQITG